MARYAAETRIPAVQSRLEIERTLSKYGATAIAVFYDKQRAIIAFEAKGRHIKITLPLPDEARDKSGKQTRQRWRALLLVIKAKLESVESGIETLEQAFYANIVMPDGQTVYEHTRETVERVYLTGQAQRLLPDYSR